MSKKSQASEELCRVTSWLNARSFIAVVVIVVTCVWQRVTPAAAGPSCPHPAQASGCHSEQLSAAGWPKPSGPAVYH